MAKDWMGYEAMTQTALRSVVRMALERAASQGLPGNHHFYITFDTNFPGVEISEYLKGLYPEEMTIVLQHQFWGLKVDDKGFEVSLSFKKVAETLVIPWPALKTFFDPSVQFGLQLRPKAPGEGEKKTGPKAVGPSVPAAATPPAPAAAKPAPAPDAPVADAPPPPPEKPAEERKPAATGGEVVSLDKFRKK